MVRSLWKFVLVTFIAAALTACGSGAGSTSSTASIAPSVLTSAEPDSATASASGSAASSDPSASASLESEPASPTDARSVEATAINSAAVRTFRIVPEQSEARYEVQEQFLRQNLPTQAIGKTNAVEGEFQFSLDGKPTGKVTRITVDLSTLKSDEGRRDNAIRGRWLESSKYPTATFTSTEAQGLPESYTEGQEVAFKLTGDMTIRDVTRPVTFDVKGTLKGDTVTGTATTRILMKDFGFDPPSVAGILTVTDGVNITVDFTAKEAK